MPVPGGTRLGPYDVVGPIGAGGMGEVYRARDTRLGRDVAIKVLPAEVATDADRRTRFEREARAVAALSHPNILALHDVGTEGDTLYVVTELLTGETLADRLRSGALPVRKAVEIAIAIARGLGAAHEKGIAHRDLKPANVFLLADGQVKLLDFGMARATVPASPGDATTQHGALTDPGTVLGTAGYMAPEQVRGLPVDGRADLFALGVVLYEMLTGQRAFARETTAETLTAILKDDPPDLATARADLPPALARIVAHALEKSPAERFQSARDVIFALETWPGGSGMAAQTALTPRRSRRWAAALAWAAAGALAALAPRVLDAPSGTPSGQDVLSVAIPPPHLEYFKDPNPALSPDGKRVAFWAPDESGRVSVWVRELSDPAARRIQGIDTVNDPERIDFGADGRTVFFTTNGTLYRAVPGTGAAEALVGSPLGMGVAQSNDGTILHAPQWGGPLQIVNAGTRTAEPVTISAGDGEDLWPAYPRFLPDGRHFLFVSTRRMQIFVGDLASRTARLLVDTASPAEFASDHLLYVQNGLLLAQPFDPSTLTLRGEARQIASGVGVNAPSIIEASFSSSTNGHVLLWEGWSAPRAELVWLGRDGARLGTVGDAGHYLGIAFAPSSSRVAAERFVLGQKRNRVELLVLDADGAAAPVRLANEGASLNSGAPVWAAGETHVYAAGFPGILRFDLTGGPAENWHDAAAFVQDRTAEGERVAFEWDNGTSTDLFITRRGAAPEPFRQTRFQETELRIAPNGRWAAWVADDTGTREVYVSGFPSIGRVTRVSLDGGRQPMWRADGRELYFLSPAHDLMVADVQMAGDTLTMARPRKLFTAPVPNGYFNRRQYAPSADGARFLFNARIEDSVPRTIKLIMNWPALLAP